MLIRKSRKVQSGLYITVRLTARTPGLAIKADVYNTSVGGFRTQPYATDEPNTKANSISRYIVQPR